ncbi:hypothetical protein [Nocardiopsis valliformis]|uniref:hypothetical protein n=1 Tax=Nocardiopsis valliformis TaxID=239974 RepID=UPI0006863ED4|nr:hypothetical protein [Nocardiopsis valliformis]
MSAEHRPRRARLAVTGALSLAFLLAPVSAGAVLADTVPGSAHEVDSTREEVREDAQEEPQAELSPTERLAADLAESPVHVDPTYSGAYPDEWVADLAERITESGVPLRVIVIPLIEGGEWSGEAKVMAAAVHDRIGGEGHYLVLDGRDLSGHDFFAPGAGADRVDRARYATSTLIYEMGFDAPASARMERALEIALSEDPEAIYQEATESQERGAFDWLYSLGPGMYTVIVVLPWVLAGLALIGLGFGVYRWRRPRAVPTLPQHAAFDNANQARLDELVERAGQELVEFGERVSTAVPVADDPEATTELHQALDAHAAARRVYDGLPAEVALADVVGVLVLLDNAEDHMARATRPAARRRSGPLRAHCYANPLHGTDTKVTRWREFGGREDVRVPLCAECAKAVRDRSRPRVLSVRKDGREVPYYELPAAESVWAATGYGALRGDLVKRILRGDHTGQRR